MALERPSRETAAASLSMSDQADIPLAFPFSLGSLSGEVLRLAFHRHGCDAGVTGPVARR